MTKAALLVFLFKVPDSEPQPAEDEEEEEEEEDESRPLPATIPATGFACKRKPCILIFDSLGGGSRAKVCFVGELIIKDWLRTRCTIQI